MKINWKRVVIGGIGSMILAVPLFILLLMVSNVIQFKDIEGWFTQSMRLSPFLSTFLGGLWVSRKIESRFILNGALVGMFPSAYWLYILLETLENNEGGLQDSMFLLTATLFLIPPIFGGMLGGFIGGIRRKRQLSAQASQA